MKAEGQYRKPEIQKDVFKYTGYLKQILPAVSRRSSKGRVFTFWPAIIEQRSDEGKVKSSILVNFHENFILDMLDKLVGEVVTVYILPNLKWGRVSYINNLNCYMVIPQRRDLWKYRQSITSTDEYSPRQTDEDGYDARYNS